MAAHFLMAGQTGRVMYVYAQRARSSKPAIRPGSHCQPRRRRERMAKYNRGYLVSFLEPLARLTQPVSPPNRLFSTRVLRPDIFVTRKVFRCPQSGK